MNWPQTERREGRFIKMLETDTTGLTTESLALQAYRHFRRALMSGQYTPGQKIKLKDVADELGISPTPVREALGRLVSEQVLSQIDRRSVRVPILRAGAYKEIRDLRFMLEGEAAARAAVIATPDQIEGLSAIHDRLCDARDADDTLRMIMENVRFHQTLCWLSDMPILSRMVENLWLKCGPMMNAFVDFPPPAPRRRHPHLDVLRGLRNRDPALAKASIQDDISTSSEPILRYLLVRFGEIDEAGSGIDRSAGRAAG